MKFRVARWLICVLIVLLSGAAIADKSRSGSLRGGVYTAPDESFQFKVPRLIDPGAFVRDVRVSEDTFKVVMGDELCRRVFIVQYAPTGFDDFDAFKREREGRLGLADPKTRSVNSPRGEIAIKTGSMPYASVCMAMTLDANGQLVPTADEGSDAGVLFVAADDAYYELGYIVSAGGAFAEMYGLGSVDDVLEQLLAEFRIAGPRVPARLPPTPMLIRFIDEESAAECTSLGHIKGKSKSISLSVDSHMNAAQAKLRKAALKLGANAIVIRESDFKRSGLSGAPYMSMLGEALKCDAVPQYRSWEIHASD